MFLKAPDSNIMCRDEFLQRTQLGILKIETTNCVKIEEWKAVLKLLMNKTMTIIHNLSRNKLRYCHRLVNIE